MRLPFVPCKWSEPVTRWGLFLMREVHHILFPGSIAYSKAEVTVKSMIRWKRATSSLRPLLDFQCNASEALSKELDSTRSSDDYQIESSTEVCPCKKRCRCC